MKAEYVFDNGWRLVAPDPEVRADRPIRRQDFDLRIYWRRVRVPHWLFKLTTTYRTVVREAGVRL